MTNQSIVDRIRKLRSKADASEFEAEARVFAEKALELMNQYHVDESQLAEPAEMETLVSSIKYLNGWRKHLLDQCARTAGVHLSWRKGTEIVQWTGRPAAARVAMDMYDHLESQIVRICQQLYPGDQRSVRRAAKGMAHQVALLLAEQRRNLPSSKLPVVQAHEEAREFAHANLNIEPGDTGLGDTSNPEYHVGRLNADRVEIHRRVD